MERRTRSSRTHRTEELAPARPPVLVGVIVVLCAVSLFVAITNLLS